jgi:hypothetical protein
LAALALEIDDKHFCDLHRYRVSEILLNERQREVDR